MRLPLVLPLMTGVALSASNVDFVCPEEEIAETGCMGPKDCVYMNTDDCSSFIYCEVSADGKTAQPIIKNCPSGLQWNDNKKECDFPENATCNNVLDGVVNTVNEGLPPSEGTLDPTFSCSDAAASQGCQGSKEPEIECIYPNPKASDSYVQCTAGFAYIVQCKSGTYKDEIKACE